MISPNNYTEKTNEQNLIQFHITLDYQINYTDKNWGESVKRGPC